MESAAMRWPRALLVTLALLAAPASMGADLPQRVIRIGMPLMPSTMDPARVDNMQAQMIMAGVYDTLYVLDPLARPAAIVPSAAAAAPEVSRDHRTFTIRVRPGIFFVPHPRFEGRARELTASDFAYALRRVHDPALHSPNFFLFDGKIAGLDALAKRAKDAGRALDYDAPVPGLVVVDRQTLQIHLNAPDPLFPFLLASPVTSALAREVVEAEGDAYGQRPVGSGAFVVAAFTPGQRMTLERNPGYRTRHWEDLSTPASRSGQLSHPMAGRRLPGSDRIELSYTPESSAELLSLRRNELDVIYLASPELATTNGVLNRDIAADGIRLVRDNPPAVNLVFFSMRDPTLGGNASEKVALRRAVQMSFDNREWIRVFTAGFAVEQEQIVPPGIDGHIPGHRDPNRFDPATANALLDRFGYRHNADGYRRKPDGSTLAIPVLAGTSSESRKAMEYTKRMLDRIGLRVRFENVTTAERLKRMIQCRYGMAAMDWGLDIPDGINPMSMFYSKAIGGANMSCFVDAEFDAAYESALVTPSGPARSALFRTMQARLDAYAPMGVQPAVDTLLLVRDDIIGPFGTITDWLQVMTLSIDAARSQRVKR